MAIKDAYETLADPSRRAEHDRRLLRSRAATPRRLDRSPISIMRDYQHYSPSADEILDALQRSFNHRPHAKAQHVRDLSVELVLSPADAARGGVVTLTLPTFRACGDCMGSGRANVGLCSSCEGSGQEEYEAQLDVIIAPRTADGTVIPVSLNHMGISNLHLRVHVRVSGGWA